VWCGERFDDIAGQVTCKHLRRWLFCAGGLILSAVLWEPKASLAAGATATVSVILLTLYFLPTIWIIRFKASGRWETNPVKQAATVFLINALTGWTLAGWLIAFGVAYKFRDPLLFDDSLEVQTPDGAVEGAGSFQPKWRSAASSG
jgi:hypothetical protein